MIDADAPAEGLVAPGDKSGSEPSADDSLPSELSEVGRLARDLIRINTSNPTHVEKPAAELVAAALTDLGLTIEWFEPEPGRCSVVARLHGTERVLPGLVAHGHLDVVPAVDSEWSADPFGGEIRDGYLWGRGAVDMKASVAVVIAAVARMVRAGITPRRDIVLAFFADEEAGGLAGAAHVTKERPDLFAGCSEAIGEVGGFSYALAPDRRTYLISAAEKGVLWARLVSEGKPGHGSMINPDNAVTALAEAVVRVARHEYDARLTPPVAGFFDRLGELIEAGDRDPEQLLEDIGPIARMIRASMRDTVNPTQLNAGYKANVVPSRASATIDARFMPGNGSALRKAIVEQAGPGVTVEDLYYGEAVESRWDTPLVRAITAALQSTDPGASVIPYMSTAFTDAKWLDPLGIQCYGFCPLQLPSDLDFTALFHGIDERVPLAALDFGVDALHHLFLTY